MNASSEWPLTRFGDVAREIREIEPNPLDNGLERYVGLDHLDPESLHIKRWGEIADSDITFTRVFRAGQVLFGRRRAYQRKAAVADFDGICSGDIIVMEASEKHLLPELLPFIVQSEGFYEHALMTSAGSLSPRTKWSHLAAYEFALPPRDEQRRIADILWAADETIEKAAEVINAIDFVVEIFRVRKFGRLQRAAVTLADLCKADGIQIGPFGSQLHASDYVENGIPVVMPSDMIDNRISEENIARISALRAEDLKRHWVLTNDILLPRRGELDRRALVQPEQEGWICGTGSIRIRLRNPGLAQAVLNALAAKQTVLWLERYAVGTTMLNLNSEIVSRIPIALPNGNDLETSLRFIETLDQNRILTANWLFSLRRLKSALLQRLVG